MVKLIQLLIFGHTHKWKLLESVNLNIGTCNGSRWVLQCETCGNIKNKDII